MKINNIEIKLKKSSYEFEVNDSVFQNSDGIFCSENSSFGGYSFAFAGFIYNMLAPLDKNKNQTYRLRQILSSEDKVTCPAKISTPVIKNARAEAKTLMSEILSVCRINHFHKIVLTHFVRINKNKHDLNLLGILDSLNENDLNFELTIVFTVDENNFESIEAIMRNYNKA